MLILAIALLQNVDAFTFQPDTTVNTRYTTHTGVQSQIYLSEEAGATPAPLPRPESFREAEVLGLRLMQEGQHEEALKVFQQGLKLPGSRTDIIRTQNISGPSPVGGAAGGTEGKIVYTLDEFESQAAHYNIACAYASLDKVSEACTSLEQAFKFGFDNYATVRADPDLEMLEGEPEFDNLMARFDKKGFFGLFK